MARDAGNRRFLGRLSVKGPSVEWGAALIVGIGIGVSLFGAHFIRDASDEESVAHDHLPRGRETILVVDDEEDLIEAATSILEGLGYRTIRASNGAEALALIRAGASLPST